MFFFVKVGSGFFLKYCFCAPFMTFANGDVLGNKLYNYTV